MISATEAKEIAGIADLSEHLAFIERKIRSAAEEGKTDVIIRDNPYAGWLYGSNRPTVAKMVIKELEESGFTCKLWYAEYQFVDMGLQIIWS